jgi:hypothetical protein
MTGRSGHSARIGASTCLGSQAPSMAKRSKVGPAC